MSYSVIMCAHNEEKYIKQALESVFRQTVKPEKVILILDRCTDRTGEIAKDYPVEIIEKKEKRWENPRAENLELARREIKSEFYAKVDADVVLEPNYFEVLLSEMGDKDACIGGKIVTRSNTILGRLLSLWERTYEVSPSRRPRGCALLIRKDVLDKIGGFIDVPAEETYIQDEALKLGYTLKITTKAKAYHIRDITLRRSIKGQFSTGMARYLQGKGLGRTFLHSLVRLRPFVIIGYFYGFLNRKNKRQNSKQKFCTKKLPC
ncbi:MAG: glycosyltransferase family 2 protein [Candidatus Brockarchaeota archaeon]|nr:glycosyltransferase family 2 protein [Candidatus Brockarchaeota archaeon]MBO3808682.1 glycosyltransferase family 2 protein [Candidatus Brockarchaeota archaeon]